MRADQPIPGMATRQHVRLSGPTDLEGFRRHARALFHHGVHPGDVVWLAERAHADQPAEDRPLFDAGAAEDMPNDVCPPDAAPDSAHVLRVPRALATLWEDLVLHADPGRFELMYRLLWRLQHEPGLRHDPLDADLILAQRMVKAVQRDIHKMRAFVRFIPVGDDHHVAWFEPAHHIVEANAPFFMRRFAQMRWAILTPLRCIEWDGATLHMRPGADRSARPPPDAGQALWLTYYAHIFNPARLKLRAMAREMPRRYWVNLPEAALIQPLARAAAERSHAMVCAEPSLPSQRYKPIMIQRPAPPADTPVPSLAALWELTQSCRNCPIGAGATQAVCGEGPAHASHMFVGEQPGDQEDLAGRPFVGPAGQLLNRAMAEIGWPRESVYVTNAVKHFKYELRGTRRMHKTPGQREVAACTPWLEQEIALVRPRHLVALGATAARALLGRPVSINAKHGRWLRERADGIPVLVTWHPSALLRTPHEARAQAYAQWQADLALAREPAARERLLPKAFTSHRGEP